MANRLRQPAFTLIEMIVSISIITMITALFIANYHFAEKRSDLTMTAQEVVSDLHAAQNNTLGLAKYNNLTPAGGWGISFNVDENSYTLFADLDAPGTPGYRQFDRTVEGNQNYGAREIVLPRGIEIVSLKLADNVERPLVNVTFLPPDPQTNIWTTGGATSTYAEIRLEETENNSAKTVRVNFFGLSRSS